MVVGMTGAHHCVRSNVKRALFCYTKRSRHIVNRCIGQVKALYWTPISGCPGWLAGNIQLSTATV